MESGKSPARGARWLSGLALLGGLAAPACAQEVSLPEQGIAFTLPDGWTYQVQQEQGAWLISLESGPTSQHGCSLNARKLPSGQSQSALNLKMEQFPSTREYWEDNLRKKGSVVTVLKTGKDMIGQALAPWVVYESAEGPVSGGAFITAKNFAAVTPTQVWTIVCGAQHATREGAKAEFARWTPVFDRFAASIRFSQ